MSTLRTRRLGALFQAELAELLTRRIKDPRLDQVTLTGVDVAPDLSQAKVYFTLHHEENRAQAEKGFQAASSYLRKQLATALHLKTVPRLVAVFDNSIGHGLRMEALIRRAKQQDELITQTGEEDTAS